MTRLQGGVLAVVAEGQQFAGVIRDLVFREAEQLAQHRQAQGGGGGASALGIQAAELAELAAAHVVLHPAAGAEAETAFEEPGWGSVTARASIRFDPARHRSELPVGALEHQLAAFVGFQPAIGEPGLLQILHLIGTLCIGHQVAVDHIPFPQARFIGELTRLEPLRPAVMQLRPDRVELLPATAAEHHRVQQGLAAGIRLILLTLEGQIAPARSLQAGMHITAGRDKLVQAEGKEAAVWPHLHLIGRQQKLA